MTDQSQPIRDLLDRTRFRWRLLRALEGAARGAFVGSAALTVALIFTPFAERSPLGLLALSAASLMVVAAALVWGLAPARENPSNRRVARFIEERTPGLDDRLATAVGLVDAAQPDGESELSAPMIADAARRARDVDIECVLPGRILHRAAIRAFAAAFLLVVLAMLSLEPARRSIDTLSMLLFPERVQLTVRPGSARVPAGSALSIEARLAGRRSPATVTLQIDQAERSRRFEMKGDTSGQYRFVVESVTAPFTYRVTVGAVVSPTYDIAVVEPLRVARIDLEYRYPPALGLRPRLEQDSGDIYGPAGTSVRLLIHTDRPASGGLMTFGTGATQKLTPIEPTLLSAALSIAGDDSYRLAPIDSEGRPTSGDTEYFIRVLENRPPRVHITKPAGDRSVTRLEEVDVEVQADDDYGIDRLELVYALRGGEERAAPIDVPRGATSVTSRQTLYLEDLGVQPGDFVSYYARARDHSTGRAANDARSDIFFLDVKPYEQEFSLAASQSMAGSGDNGTLDELVNRQRQVVVATWKLTRRAEASRGARSERDTRAIAATESNLQALVEQAASSFHETTMRDPRQRGPVGALDPRSEDDSMAAAAAAMRKAVAALEALDGGAALPPEMQALNHLLKAQAEIKRRQISANQAAAAAAGNTSRNYDISTLFDRELQRQQQTNYETTVPRSPSSTDVIDRIEDLARRQDELLRREQRLSAGAPNGEDRRRELERLTREQSDLRELADKLAREMAGGRNPQDNKTSNARGPSVRQGAESRGRGENSRASDVAEVSEAMRQAAGDLRRGAPDQAGVKSTRARDLLRDVERRLRDARPDRSRAIGEMWFEAEELADRQHQIADARGRLAAGNAGIDALRRLAGDQERLAERMRRLQEALDGQVPDRSSERNPARQQANALREAARETRGLADRMRQAAEEMRSSRLQTSRPPADDLSTRLERLADRLNTASGGASDDRKLARQIARAQEIREKLDEVDRALQDAGQTGRAGGGNAQKTGGENGRIGEGRRGAGGRDMSELHAESLRGLQEAQKLLEEMRRQDPSLSRNGAGFTFEGQGLVLSAPGTEAFKQDFARWENLKRQATTALELAEHAFASKKQARTLKDRLAAGVEDRAPAEYQADVDAYFKAIARPK